MSLLVRYYRTCLNRRSAARLFTPFKGSLEQVPVLESRGNRPLQMTFKDQLKILPYDHLEEHSSGRHLVQILAGLITYLLLAIYCHEEHGERVSINRVRKLHNNIRHEAAEDAAAGLGPPDIIDLDFGAYATS